MDLSQEGYYNQEETQQVKYPSQPQRRQKVSPVKSPAVIRATPPGTPAQYQSKAQPTYTIQYTKPNPFADPLPISPYKKQTSSTALSNPVTVQKPMQVSKQPLRAPTTVQRNVTIKYNQPD